nr:hypothetical protein [Tanacetum cinerariifolium]
EDKKMEEYQNGMTIFQQMKGVPNEDFVAPPFEEDLLTFLIELGYKGSLDHLARMFVDHMNQPWRTLETIINKKNVEYPELIWEDFAYPIDYRQEKLRRRELMPYLRFTKIIINHILLLNPSIPKGPSSGLHTIKYDGVISRLKFVRIGEDFQEYGRAIPDTMLTEDIKPSGIAFRDTSSVSKNKSPVQSQKLKGIQTLTVKEHLAADIMQALKSKQKISKSQSHTRVSSEGAGVTPEVPDKSTSLSKSSSKGTGTVPRVLDEVKDASEAKADFAIYWCSEDESEYSEEAIVNEEIEWVIVIENFNDDEEINYEFMHGDEYVHDDVDEEMKDAEDAKTRKDDKEITDAEKMDAKKAEATKDSADTKINSLLDIQIQQEVPQIQSLSLLTVPVSVIPEQIILVTSLVLSTVTPVTTALLQDSTVTTTSHVIQQTKTQFTPPITIEAPSVTTTVLDPLPEIIPRESELEKDGQEIKQVDHSPSIHVTIRSQTSSASKETSKGKTLPKSSKTRKSAAAKESVKEATHEVTIGDEEPVQENVNDVDQA